MSVRRLPAWPFSAVASSPISLLRSLAGMAWSSLVADRHDLADVGRHLVRRAGDVGPALERRARAGVRRAPG